MNATFDPPEISETLIFYDRPLLFVAHWMGELFLGSWCGDQDFILAMVVEETVQDLKNGALSIREAMRSPIIYLATSGELWSADRAKWAEVEQLLPPEGVPLREKFQPVLGVRTAGANEDEPITLGVVEESSKRLRKTLRTALLQQTEGDESTRGTAEEITLYNPPVTNLAMGSCEIAVDRPDLDLWDKTFDKMVVRISDSLEWLDSLGRAELTTSQDEIIAILKELLPGRSSVRHMSVYGRGFRKVFRVSSRHRAYIKTYERADATESFRISGYLTGLRLNMKTCRIGKSVEDEDDQLIKLPDDLWEAERDSLKSTFDAEAWLTIMGYVKGKTYHAVSFDFPSV